MSLNKQQTARNILTTVATQLASWALSFVAVLFVPAYLGPTGTGRIAFASSFVTVLGLLSRLGTTTVILRETARDHGRAARLLLGAIVLRIPLGLLAIAIAALVARLIGPDTDLLYIVLAASCAMFVGAMGDTVTASLQGQERVARSSIGQLIIKVGDAALSIVLVFLKAPLWMFPAVPAVSNLIALGLNAPALRPLGGQVRALFASGPRPALGALSQEARFLMVAGMPFLGWNIFRQLYGYTDPLVLRFVTTEAVIGWYALAFRLIGTTLFIPNALCQALMPTLTRLFAQDRAQFESLARRLFVLVMLCAMPLCFVLLFLSGEIIHALRYKPEFYGAIPALSVGGIASLLWFAGIALGTLVIASDGQQAMFRSSVVATLVGVPLCFAGSLLTRQWLGNAAVGAMASDAALELVQIGFYLRALPMRLLDARMAGTLARMALACVPMALFLHYALPRGLGLWAALPGLALYGLACLLLGVIDRAWFAALKAAISRKETAPAPAA